MTRFEVVVLAASVALIAVLAIAAWQRGRTGSSATLPLRMYALRMSLGVVFLFLGVIGSVLPILQGWIFFLLAALMFFPNSRFTEKIIRKAEPKLPRVVAFLRRLGIGADGRPGEERPGR